MDFLHQDYNGASPDGTSWKTPGDVRYLVVRGGSWRTNANNCRSANRWRFEPLDRGDHIGFRVVAAARTP